jgi:hypothetical protein
LIRDSLSSFVSRPPQSSGRSSARNRGFEFEKRGQLFIRANDEAISIAAMRVRDKDRSPVGIHRCNAAPTPTGFADVVSDYFPVISRSNEYFSC